MDIADTSNTQNQAAKIAPYIPYVLPFFLFAFFTVLGPKISLTQSIIYPLKTTVVAICLLIFLPKWKKEIHITMDWPAILAGIIVFGLWIGLEGIVFQVGEPKGFNPYQISPDWSSVLIGFRLLGAVLIVPIMEELFWRSFALRFLIETRFNTLPLGTFSWFSFIMVSIAFGLEHHRWLPGIIAGLAYALLLYRTKNLFSPILSHAVTNLLLGLYILITSQWKFW